jgi:hypothetical protein
MRDAPSNTTALNNQPLTSGEDASLPESVSRGEARRIEKDGQMKATAMVRMTEQALNDGGRLISSGVIVMSDPPASIKLDEFSIKFMPQGPVDYARNRKARS